MAKALRSMRVSDEDWAAWKQAAQPLTISAWLHKLAADKIGAGEVADPEGPAGDVRGSTGTLEGTSSPEPPPPEPATDCAHPKGARIVRNASLGLVSCGACGATRNTKGEWSS